MSIQSSLSQADRSAILVTSLVVGSSLGLAQSSILFLSGVISQPEVIREFTFIITSLGLAAPLIWVIGYLLLGILVGKRTGDIRQGARAGLCTGVFGGLGVAMGQVALAILHLYFYTHIPPGTLITMAAVDPRDRIVETTALAFLTMGVLLGAGTGFGALGALIGQYLAPERSQPKELPASSWLYETHDQTSYEPMPLLKLH